MTVPAITLRKGCYNCKHTDFQTDDNPCLRGHSATKAKDCPNIEDHQAWDRVSQAELYDAVVNLPRKDGDTYLITAEDVGWLWKRTIEISKSRTVLTPGVECTGVTGIHITTDDGVSFDIELYVVYDELLPKKCSFDERLVEGFSLLTDMFDQRVGEGLRLRLANNAKAT